MKIVKVKGRYNEFKIEGLTVGKILAIERALEETKLRSTLQDAVLELIKDSKKNLVMG